MKAQAGQIKDIQKILPSVTPAKITIIAEGGNDNGETFSGSFLAKIGRKCYRITDGKLIKVI